MAAISTAAMLKGGLAGRRPTDGELQVLGSFRNGNHTMQLLLDASVRATRRVRGQSADLYDLMAALDAVPFTPRNPVSSADRVVPIYGGTYRNVRVDYGSDPSSRWAIP